MGKRRFAREYALKALYNYEMNEDKDAQAVIRDMRFIADKEKHDNVQWEYMEDLFNGVLKHKEKIDSYISGAVNNWDVGRLALVDRNILRLATYEMLYRYDVDDAVVIDEAIEIGKLYGEKNTYSFINGVLDNIAKELRKDKN